MTRKQPFWVSLYFGPPPKRPFYLLADLLLWTVLITLIFYATLTQPSFGPH